MKKAYTPSTEALGPPSPEVQHKATLGHKEPAMRLQQSY